MTSEPLTTDQLLVENEQLKNQVEWMKTAALQMAVKALAMIGTYGSRDEGGLRGLSLAHWKDITRLEEAIREKSGYKGFVVDTPGMIWACPRCGKRGDSDE